MRKRKHVTTKKKTTTNYLSEKAIMNVIGKKHKQLITLTEYFRLILSHNVQAFLLKRTKKKKH